MPEHEDHSALIAKNRKALHDYEVLETLEAGIALTGTEVKSCRARNVPLQDACALVENGEVLLHNAHINEYEMGNRFNHEPKRVRKLLVHRSEIRKLKQQTEQKGFTLVPLSFYLKRGKVKVSLGVCRGKTLGDKRQTLRRKEDERAMRRALRARR